MIENLTYRKLIRNLLFDYYDADDKTLDKNIGEPISVTTIVDIIYMYPLGEEGNKNVILKIDEGKEDEY